MHKYTKPRKFGASKTTQINDINHDDIFSNREYITSHRNSMQIFVI